MSGQNVTQMKPSGRVVIAGGTGFLGKSLAKHLLAEGCEVTTISRTVTPLTLGWRHAQWDARTLGDWVSHLDGASALVNLTGRTVDCVKTPDHCDEILRSRVESTTLLGRALEKVKTRPPVWVQMGTAHIYGDPPDVVCDEESALGYGLAPIVGRAWEDAFERAVPVGVRRVVFRTSFVLGRRGGALRRLATLARFGLGGTVGQGRQGISWIHELDMNRLFTWAIADESVAGTYVATAPNPVSNAEFMRELRHAVRAPFGLPARSWMVRAAAALVLRTDPELALYGRYCVSRRLSEQGFEFAFPDLRAALLSLYRPGSGTS